MSAHEHLNPQQFFHGTSTERVWKIESDGLKGVADTGRWHVTSDLGHAQRHAWDVARSDGGDPAVFAVDLEGHPSWAGSLGEHHRTGKEPIPPERLRLLPNAGR